MKINDILILKYPYADFRKDIVLKDNGDGIIYIKEWNLPTPQPTTKEIEQWGIDLQQEYEDNQTRLIKQAEYPTIDRLVVAMWKASVENDDSELRAVQAERLVVQEKYNVK